MSATEQAVLDTLRELERAATTPRSTTQASSGVRPLLDRLDQLTEQLPEDASPELRHFLQRKSYEKARLLLEGRGASNRRGSCGH